MMIILIFKAQEASQVEGKTQTGSGKVVLEIQLNQKMLKKYVPENASSLNTKLASLRKKWNCQHSAW